MIGFVAVRCCVWAAAGMIVFGAGGCVAPARPEVEKVATVQVAEVVVNNRTPYAWRLVFRTAAGVAVKEADVAPRESGVVRIAGGVDYVIDQAIVTPGVRVAARSVAMRFEAGERYGWELATLLTAEGKDVDGEGEARRTGAVR